MLYIFLPSILFHTFCFFSEEILLFVYILDFITQIYSFYLLCQTGVAHNLCLSTSSYLNYSISLKVQHLHIPFLRIPHFCPVETNTRNMLLSGDFLTSAKNDKIKKADSVRLVLISSFPLAYLCHRKQIPDERKEVASLGRRKIHAEQKTETKASLPLLDSFPYVQPDYPCHCKCRR